MATIERDSFRCSICREEKPRDAFGRDARRPSGLSHRCKLCDRTRQSERTKQRLQDRRLEAKEYVRSLTGQPTCVICGEDDPVTLDWHHVNPSEKHYNIAQLVNRLRSLGNRTETYLLLQRELEKCVSVCANCHRRLHAGTVALPENVVRATLPDLPDSKVTTLAQAPGRRQRKSPEANPQPLWPHGMKRSDLNGPNGWEAQFWSQCSRTTGCWIWERAAFNKGYGAVQVGDRLFQTHRVAYVLSHGEIPAGFVVSQTCKNRLCINPAHLYIRTRRAVMEERFADAA